MHADDSPALKSLRDRATAKIAKTPAAAPDPAPDHLKLLHELQVHQVELQLQNEELMASQAALEAALQRQRLIYDGAPVGYCTVDVEGLILEANLLAGTLLNCPREALIGRRLGELLTADGAEALQGLLQHTAAWPSLHSCEVDGAADPASGRTLQIDARREPDGRASLLALIDISARKQAEALRQRAQIAEQANEAKSMFFAQMNHELRTPLNAILGFSHLLRQQRDVELGDTQRKWVEHIARAGLHTLALVSDGLDLARIEAGSVEATLEPVLLDAALAQALALVETLALAQTVHIGLATASTPGLQVLATPRLLNQILLNLLSNAIKYNRPGGSVELLVRAEAGRVILEISDTGEGLGADQMARLFQPFARLGAENGSTEGTGLGLVISRRLAQAMQGALSLHSQPGVGTTASLELMAVA